MSEDSNIRVAIRIRPMQEYNGLSTVNYGRCLTVQGNKITMNTNSRDPNTFVFDKVIDEDSRQADVFLCAGKGIVDNCVMGYNGTIFAYGQTGSGKTFTMLGPTSEDESTPAPHEMRGVIPRSFEYLFSVISREQQKRDITFSCKCSFVEIYNEHVYDLLDPTGTAIQIHEDKKKGIFLSGAAERDVGSPQDAFDILETGNRNRRVASTAMNRESSRSHAVFTLHIQSKEVKGTVINTRVSQLHLVDLAGSERQKDTHSVGARLKEAGNINKSLSALGNVIRALEQQSQGTVSHIPYRNSRLTYLLRDSLGGNAKTFIIANVNPSERCFGESLSTLGFASRAKLIRNRAVINEEAEGNVATLQEEVRRLKAQLALMESGGSPRHSESLAGSVGDEEELLQLLRGAIESRDVAEHDREAAQHELLLMRELASRRENQCSKAKMIIKFREATIRSLEGKATATATKGAEGNARVSALEAENKLLREQIEHHPEVTRFAADNLRLQNELDRVKRMYSGVEAVEEDGKMVHATGYDVRDAPALVNERDNSRRLGNRLVELESALLSATLGEPSPTTTMGAFASATAPAGLLVSPSTPVKTPTARSHHHLMSPACGTTPTRHLLQHQPETPSRRLRDRERIEELETQLRDLQDSYAAVQVQTRESELALQRTIVRLETESAASQRKAKEIELALQTTQLRLSSAASAALSEEVEVRTKLQRLDESELRAAKLEEMLEQRETEMEEQLEGLRTELKDTVAEHKKMAEELERVQQRAAEADVVASAAVRASHESAERARVEYLRLEEENVCVGSELAVLQGDLRRLKEEHAELEAEHEIVVKECAFKEEQEKVLRSALEEKERGHKETLVECDKLKEELEVRSRGATEELCESREAVSVLRKDCERLTSEIARVSAAEKGLRVTCEAQRERLDVLSCCADEVQELKGVVARLEEDLQSERVSMAESACALDAASEELSAIEAERRAAYNSVRDREEEVKLVREMMGRRESEHEEEMKEMEKKVIAVEKELVETQGRLKGMEEWRRRAEAVEEKVGNLERKLVRESGEEGERKRTVQTVMEQAEVRGALVEQQRTQIESLTSQIEFLSNMVSDWEKTVREKDAEIESLKRKVRNSGGTSNEDRVIAQMQRESLEKRLEASRKDYEAQLDALRTELAALKDRHRELDALCQSNMTEKRKIESRLVLMSEQFEMKRAQCEQSEEDAALSLEELEKTKVVTSAIEEENAQYKAQIERMEMDIKALRSANERVEALNEKLGGQTSARERVRTEEKLKRENSTLLMEIARLKRRTSEMARAERTSGGDTQLGFALAVNESDETKENALNLSFQTF